MESDDVPMWHVTWSTVGRHPIAPDEAARRALVRVLVERAAKVLVLFCVVDDHVHLVLLCDDDTRRKVVRAVGYALRTASKVPLQEPYVEPVETRTHAERLVPYVLNQAEHHGLGVASAAWSGSCLPDLLGARDVGWKSQLWKALPRLRQRELYTAVRMPAVRLGPVSDAVVRAAGPTGLAAAASAAFGVDPALSGRSDETALAVAAAAHLARAAGLPLAALAAALGRERASVSRAASRPVDERALRTVRLQLAFRAAVAAIPAAAAPGGAGTRVSGSTSR
jgi:hypothetical protein